MNQAIYVGLDIGTTAIKVSAVTRQLEAVYEEQYAYDYLTPQKGWTEIEPDTWVEIVLEGLKDMFQQIPAETVAGIGITGQMHTTVFVDKHGLSVRPAILWNDNRTKEQISHIKQRLETTKPSAHIAKIVSTGSPLASLLWLKENEPENYQKTAKILIAKDYVKLKLTGTYSTDYCDASTSSLYDLTKDDWSKEVQQLFEFNESLFPVIKPASTIIGQLTCEVCTLLDIEKQIPMVSGTGDNVASALVSGSFEHDQPLVSLGTSGVVVIPNSHHQLKQTGKNVVAKITEDDQSIITQGTVQAGAKVNSWWMESILHSDHYSKAQAQIPKELLGENEVLFFPHMNGEKTLFSDPSLKGAFVGLGLETTREEMYLAVLEGLAYGIRQLFRSMKNDEQPDYFTIVGGGAKSELWIEIFANVLGRPIKRVLASQEAVHGAAILAIMGVEGHFTFPDSEFQMIEPHTSLIKKYDKAYQKYLKLTQMILLAGGK
ncbi:xylulokinase [Enterococcus florum]|uniref:Xylulokinase n=1 Tax=Enterococcus florum TaxID=2480627 RepID=A0A4P5PEZ3_9ENTE|nr:FGGY family carbohydrate kinase [Enterococcus florum]GCF95284.1 xylulokinase [Enterococcus florum]